MEAGAGDPGGRWGEAELLGAARGGAVTRAMEPPPAYVDRRAGLGPQEYHRVLQESCTCYIGNLSFYTTETQLWAAFSRFGPVERIVMGLDRHRRTPCGFAFVIYAQKEGADLAVSWLNGTTLDERPIRVDKDHGFREGRQFGRGRSGGQVRDEHRLDYDSGRGGFGRRSDAPGPQGGAAGAGAGGGGGAAEGGGGNIVPPPETEEEAAKKKA